MSAAQPPKPDPAALSRAKVAKTDGPSDEERLLAAEEARIGQWRQIWRRFRRSRLGMAGLAILMALYGAVLFAEFIAPYHYTTGFTEYVHAPPQRVHLGGAGLGFRPYVCDMTRGYAAQGLLRVYSPDRAKPIAIHFLVPGEPYRLWGLIPARRHLFGSPDGPVALLGFDRMGRDLLSRTIYGARISMTIGLLGVVLSIVLGSVLGTVSGYYGGWIDHLIQRFIELLASFPSIPLWMALAAALPPEWSSVKVYFGITVILSVLGWGGLARQLRGIVLAYREQDFVMAARCAGASDGHIIFRHLVPGCTSHILVIATLSVPGMILGETALSFLGLGIRAPMTSWGVLLEEAQHIRVLTQYPWLVLPAVPVLLAVLGFNFVGDALRDAADPHGR